MMAGVYPVCELHLTRRRCIKFAIVAGMVPDLRPERHAARAADQAVPRFIERYTVGTDDPWALVHTIRGVGGSCSVSGESAGTKIRSSSEPPLLRGPFHAYRKLVSRKLE